MFLALQMPVLFVTKLKWLYIWMKVMMAERALELLEAITLKEQMLQHVMEIKRIFL